jgi:hypothetical protein
MKKFTLLFALAILFALIHPFSTNAQWYKSYGVTDKNELAEDQCREGMKKAANIVSLGKVTSIMGGVCAVAGGIAFSTFYIVRAVSPSIDPGAALMILSVSIVGKGYMFLGGVITAIGIPIWITGAVRRVNIRTALSKFPAKIALSPGFIKGYNHYSPGLSVVITF